MNEKLNSVVNSDATKNFLRRGLTPLSPPPIVALVNVKRKNIETPAYTDQLLANYEFIRK